MITHYDLFAGIGGFSLALEEVFDEPIRHIFCERESFPTQVLKKHWPDGEFWGDIAELVTHTKHNGHRGKKQGVTKEASSLPAQHRSQDSTARQLKRTNSNRKNNQFTIVTGGFPCQPFSAAGRRRGTSDDRYKWPEMFVVIRNVQPAWVIAENVRGLVTWNEGMVLEQVCSDLESEGYEVQPLIIPAVAVNAPHRRDRVWIIANRRHAEHGGRPRRGDIDEELTGPKGTDEDSRQRGSGESRIWEKHEPGDKVGDATDNKRTGLETSKSRDETERQRDIGYRSRSEEGWSWTASWPEVAAELCVVDDGLSSQLVGLPDGTQISYPKWRKESLKAGGNAIVPQVAVEIMKAIKDANDSTI